MYLCAVVVGPMSIVRVGLMSNVLLVSDVPVFQEMIISFSVATMFSVQ